jgi:hypothetical protein
MFCSHHSSVKSCRVYESKGRWLQIIMSKLLPEIAFFAGARCFVDGARSFWSIINKLFKTYEARLGRGGTTGAESHARRVYVHAAWTASPLPPTPSTTQEVSAANISRHSAGATRRPKTSTTASWRLALPWVSLRAGSCGWQGPSEGPISRARQPLRAPR